MDKKNIVTSKLQLNFSGGDTIITEHNSGSWPSFSHPHKVLTRLISIESQPKKIVVVVVVVICGVVVFVVHVVVVDPRNLPLKFG